MNGNSIPPGYRSDDRLWTQDTEVFEAIDDDYRPDAGRGAPGSPKSSQASKYAIIGLSATIAIAVLAIGGLLLSGHGSWNAAPNAATGPSTPRVVLTPPAASPHPTLTTTPQSADSTSTSATTSTTTTTTTPAISVQAVCDQPGQSALTPDGTVVTCDVSTDARTRWLPVSRPALGSPCNAAEAGTFATPTPTTQLICTRRSGTTTPSYVWDAPGTLTTGKHDPGQACNLKKDVIAQSTTGRAVYCLPTPGTNPSQYVGTWQPPS